MNKFITFQITKIFFILNKLGSKPGEQCSTEFLFMMVGCTQAGIYQSRRASFSKDLILPQRDERLQHYATWPKLRPCTVAYLLRSGASGPKQSLTKGWTWAELPSYLQLPLWKVEVLSKYLHPDANAFLDLWSFAQWHECFLFKDSGALVRTIHRLLALRVSALRVSEPVPH